MIRWFFAVVVWAIVAAGCASFSHAGFDVIQNDMLKLGEGAGTPGGIFTVDVLEAGSYGDIDFYTMCVELSETVTYGTVYKVSNDVLNDGFQTRNSNKSLSEQTAWLYTQANIGTLPLYSPTTGAALGTFLNFATLAPMATSTAREHANALQLAIWLGMSWTEAEIAAVDGGGGLWTSSYISTLKDYYLLRTDGEGWLDMFADDAVWSGFGDVRIMNLVKVSSTDPNVIKSYHPDQLVWLNPRPPGSSVPELPTFYTSSALMVGAFACSILMQRRKHRVTA
jgi:hypothetical protein